MKPFITTMSRFILLLFLISCAQPLWAQRIQRSTLYSPQIKDSFLLQVRLPKGYKPGIAYHHIYVPDGSLKMGNYILGKDSSWRADVPESCIIISIAHTGNWHEQRQRDFLPSDAGGYSDKNFGHARHFYLFLKNTLMPSVRRLYGASKSTAFIGHSFSGLFCLYTLFQEDKLFDRHFAISPSVWANNRELLKIEKLHAVKSKQLSGEVSLLAGGLEVFNKVLSSTREFYDTTLARKYLGYKVTFGTINNANHYSIIKPGVDRALASFKN